MSAERAIEFVRAYQELEAAKQASREAEARLVQARAIFREAEGRLPPTDYNS